MSPTLALQHLCHIKVIWLIYLFFIGKWLNNVPIATNTSDKPLTVNSGHLLIAYSLYIQERRGKNTILNCLGI